MVIGMNEGLTGMDYVKVWKVIIRWR